VQVGDSVEVGGVSGSVSRIGVRSSTVRTWEGADVILPNATLIAERLTNWTHSHRTRRVDLRIGVACGADPRCAREHPAVLAQPEPIAMLIGFGERGLELELEYWAQLDDLLKARTEVALAAHDALIAAGIGLAYPQRDLNLRSISPEAARELRGDGANANE
jgi:small-conductance mechanosensitive channel